MIITSSITIGVSRLALLWLFIFYCNKKLVKYNKSLNFIDFLVTKWVKYGSIALLLIFVLVQLDIYDLFNVLFVFSLILMLDYFGFKNLKIIYHNIVTRIKKELLFALKKIEKGKSIFYWLRIKGNKKQKLVGIKSILIVVFISVLTFISRSHFLKYDNYALSELWIANLKKVHQISDQHWFFDTNILVGEHALMNLYCKITNLSAEVALQTFGILEVICLSIIVFWSMKRISKSNFVVPLITTLVFALFYNIIPLDLYYLAQHRPIFMGLTFLIPVMITLIKPSALGIKNNSKMFFVTVFIAIGLIDLFVFTILLSTYLLVILCLGAKKELWIVKQAIFSYFIALIFIGCVYGVATTLNDSDFTFFIKSNLISITSYTYTPHLVIPFNELLNYLQFSSLLAILITGYAFIKGNKKYQHSLILLSYFNVLLFLEKMDVIWLDVDLLYLSLAVLSPIVIGILLFLIETVLIKFIKNQLLLRKYIYPTSTIIALLVLVLMIHQTTFERLEKTNNTSQQILSAYDKIATKYMTYTYAVINDKSTEMLSTQRHYFINYSDFNSSYIYQDSIYQQYRTNKDFLEKNPQFVLPHSILLFVYKDQKKTSTNNIFIDQELMNETVQQLNILKNKGRKINVFYESDDLKVYEIINEPRSSKIADLIF